MYDVHNPHMTLEHDTVGLNDRILCSTLSRNYEMIATVLYYSYRINETIVLHIVAKSCREKTSHERTRLEHSAYLWNHISVPILWELNLLDSWRPTLAYNSATVRPSLPSKKSNI